MYTHTQAHTHTHTTHTHTHTHTQDSAHLSLIRAWPVAAVVHSSIVPLQDPPHLQGIIIVIITTIIPIITIL